MKINPSMYINWMYTFKGTSLQVITTYVILSDKCRKNLTPLGGVD